MSFKRKGDAKSINVLEYDEDKEENLECPRCKNVIAKQYDGIYRFGSKKIIGKVSMECPKCGKEIII